MSFITDLLSKVTNLRIKIGDKLNILKREIGQLDSLTTNDKSSLVLAVNEVNRKAVVHDGNLTINATNGLTGSGSFTANQQTNSNINIKIDDDTLTKINNGNIAHSWGDHKSVYTHQYLGATYVYGGIRKPSDFGSCKLKLEMVNGSVFGNGQIWNDVLWMSSYTGEDVAGSNALVFGKMGDEIGFIRQDFNSETWGTYHKIWHSGNFNPDSKANTVGNYQDLTVGNSTLWGGQVYEPTDNLDPLYLMSFDQSNNTWKPTNKYIISNWLRTEINKINPAGLKEATYGSWYGIIQEYSESNPTHDWYNKLKILHDNSYGYSTELAQGLGSEGIFYRSTVQGQTSNWTKLWDKNDFNDTRVSNWDTAYNSIGFPLSNLTTTDKTSLVGAVNEVNRKAVVNDGKLTLTTSTGLNGSTNFTANQSSNSIFDVSIASTHKLPSTAEWEDVLKKDESNIVTENFSIERNYSNGDTFSMGVRANPSGYGEMSIGVSDDNAEGVRFLFSRDNIKMRGADSGDDSMVMDGDKITFAQYSPNKTSNDLAQMQDLDNLKQWIINNFLSLNGGTVNGDIFANKFEEN